jgi:hypothetical protein
MHEPMPTIPAMPFFHIDVTGRNKQKKAINGASTWGGTIKIGNLTNTVTSPAFIFFL